jgi:hypothetical protein
MPFRIFNSTSKLIFSVKKELDFRLMWVIKNNSFMLFLNIYFAAKSGLSHTQFPSFMASRNVKDIFLSSSSGYYLLSFSSLMFLDIRLTIYLNILYMFMHEIFSYSVKFIVYTFTEIFTFIILYFHKSTKKEPSRSSYKLFTTIKKKIYFLTLWDLRFYY